MCYKLSFRDKAYYIRFFRFKNKIKTKFII